MENIKISLKRWGEGLKVFKLPRWHELPEIELYMDQVITLIERYVSPIIIREKHTVLTSSMVNNYVKLGLIPSPNRKRYNQKHLAFLVAITILKQVLTITEIREGILFQGAVTGIREAYDLFCEEQEAALSIIISQAMGQKPTVATNQVIPIEYMAVKAATMAFSTKLLTEKVIELEQLFLEENGENNDE